MLHSQSADIDLLEVTESEQSSHWATLLCWKHLEHLLVEGGTDGGGW